MDKPYHEEVYRQYTIKIYTDDNPESPREWDNLGTMACFHSRYTLGDDKAKHGYSQDDVESWDEWPDKLKKDGAAIVLLLSLYDHSGITIRVGAPTDRWDSGYVGFVFVTKEKLLKEYGGKKVTKAMLAKAEGVLRGEVENYDDYIKGNVYGYTITDPNGDDGASCWGFLGDYDGKDYGALREARSIIDNIVDSTKEYTVAVQAFATVHLRAKNEVEAAELGKKLVVGRLEATTATVVSVSQDLVVTNRAEALAKEE